MFLSGALAFFRCVDAEKKATVAEVSAHFKSYAKLKKNDPEWIILFTVLGIPSKKYQIRKELKNMKSKMFRFTVLSVFLFISTVSSVYSHAPEGLNYNVAVSHSHGGSCYHTHAKVLYLHAQTEHPHLPGVARIPSDHGSPAYIAAHSESPWHATLYRSLQGIFFCVSVDLKTETQTPPEN